MFRGSFNCRCKFREIKHRQGQNKRSILSDPTLRLSHIPRSTRKDFRALIKLQPNPTQIEIDIFQGRYKDLKPAQQTTDTRGERKIYTCGSEYCGKAQFKLSADSHSEQKYDISGHRTRRKCDFLVERDRPCGGSEGQIQSGTGNR